MILPFGNHTRDDVLKTNTSIGKKPQTLRVSRARARCRREKTPSQAGGSLEDDGRSSLGEGAEVRVIRDDREQTLSINRLVGRRQNLNRAGCLKETFACSLKLNAHLSLVSPYHAAGSQELVDRDEEMERVRNAGRALQL